MKKKITLNETMLKCFKNGEFALFRDDKSIECTNLSGKDTLAERDYYYYDRHNRLVLSNVRPSYMKIKNFSYILTIFETKKEVEKIKDNFVDAWRNWNNTVKPKEVVFQSEGKPEPILGFIGSSVINSGFLEDKTKQNTRVSQSEGKPKRETFTGQRLEIFNPVLGKFVDCYETAVYRFKETKSN